MMLGPKKLTQKSFIYCSMTVNMLELLGRYI
jgi:hypothetical protein